MSAFIIPLCIAFALVSIDLINYFCCNSINDMIILCCLDSDFSRMKRFLLRGRINCNIENGDNFYNIEVADNNKVLTYVFDKKGKFICIKIE